jgi:hypothetical protein
MNRSVFRDAMARLGRQAAMEQTALAVKVLTTEPRPLPPLTDAEAALLRRAREILKQPAGHWEPYGPEDDPWKFNLGGRWGKWVAHPRTAEENEVVAAALALSAERDRLAWGEP